MKVVNKTVSYILNGVTVYDLGFIKLKEPDKIGI